MSKPTDANDNIGNQTMKPFRNWDTIEKVKEKESTDNKDGIFAYLKKTGIIPLAFTKTKDVKGVQQ